MAACLLESYSIVIAPELSTASEMTWQVSPLAVDCSVVQAVSSSAPRCLIDSRSSGLGPRIHRARLCAGDENHLARVSAALE
jgi:hypothetical protein